MLVLELSQSADWSLPPEVESLYSAHLPEGSRLLPMVTSGKQPTSTGTSTTTTSTTGGSSASKSPTSSSSLPASLPGLIVDTSRPPPMPPTCLPPPAARGRAPPAGKSLFQAMPPCPSSVGERGGGGGSDWGPARPTRGGGSSSWGTRRAWGLPDAEPVTRTGDEAAAKGWAGEGGRREEAFSIGTWEQGAPPASTSRSAAASSSNWGPESHEPLPDDDDSW